MNNRIKIPRWRRSVKWAFRLLTGLGVTIIYYFVFSIFFDTPLEYSLKKSTQKLEQEYTELSIRYDSLSSVLQNISDRDRAIYKTIFEAEPYDSSMVKNRERTTNFEQLLTKTNKEMGDELLARTGQLYQRIYNVQARVDSTERLFELNRHKINQIPSIQPVTNPDLTLLAASFGNRIHPFYKSMSMHKGIDFAVPTGTAVFATADGVVSEIQTRGQSTGLSLKIEHPESGYETYFANLDKVLVQPGRRVLRGDVIALSGNSGQSFGPHLHYEVRLEGKAIDPINYFFMEVDIKRQDKLRKVASIGMQSFD